MGVLPGERTHADARRFYEHLNRALTSGNLSELDDVIARDVVDRNPVPGMTQGLEGIKEAFREVRLAFPDLLVTVEDVVAEGDKAACRVSTRGTHRGAFQGIRATGKQVRQTGIDILRFAGGKVVERWGEFDALGLLAQLGAPAGTPSVLRVAFRTVYAGGVDVFYREVGPADAPVLLLLHGFPSSSRMFMPLFTRLATRHRLVAPDLPGFGHSSAPLPESFAYTFDRLAEVVGAFCERLGLSRYALYLQDYGGPVGFRLALAHPERVEALVIQNAVAHEEGLSAAWGLRRAFWRDRAAHEAEVRRAMLSLDTARARHLHGPHQEFIDPDTWRDEHAFLSREGMDRIQLELAYDYGTNVAAYPAWQAWLRESQPALLVAWGRHDPLFTERGAWAYRDEVPAAEVHLLEAGHFALDLEADVIAQLVDGFLSRIRDSARRP
jgi:pimeloyl-ACP methyl ester carboxylesterase/predicted ester cyclase